MLCVFCLTNTGFVQCYSLGSLKVCCTLKLVLYCALFSNFLFCVLCLTNIGFGQCFSFGSRKEDAFVTLRTLFCVYCLKKQGGLCSATPSAPVKFFCMLEFILHYSAIFCFACFASPTSGLCSAFPSAPLKFTPFWFSLFYSVCFCYACFA